MVAVQDEVAQPDPELGAARLTRLEDVESATAQRLGEQPHLRRLTRSVAPLERDEQPGLRRRHARDARPDRGQPIGRGPQMRLTLTWGQSVTSPTMTTQPTPLREVRRLNDWAPDEPGELVGLLLPVDDGEWVPATVFGAALGPATDEELAESIVRERGLSSLAERWWVRVGDADWREAWLLEVKTRPDPAALGRPDAHADGPRRVGTPRRGTDPAHPTHLLTGRGRTRVRP